MPNRTSFVFAVPAMSFIRMGMGGIVAPGAMRALGIVLALSCKARAQSPTQGEGSSTGSAPTAIPSEKATATPPTEEPRPAEFPGMLQGGVVAPPAASTGRPWSTQRNFALIATAGSMSGSGLGFRSGLPRVGMDASFGFFPVFATYSPDPETFPKFKFLFGYAVNASIYVALYRPDARTDLGISFGYQYSSLLRHGVNAAFYLQRELAPHWTLQAFVGPCIFPDAENQIRKETGWTQGSVSSGLAWHQAGVGLSLAFFP